MSDTTPVEFTEGQDSRQLLKNELAQRQAALMQLTPAHNPLERATVQYEIADIMLELEEPGMREAAWGMTRESFEIFRDHEMWEDAVRCCDVLFRCDLPASVPALGNGLWLAVTYPIDPQLTLIMLNHLIDATPPQSDGAAVAATVAHYIADLRLEGEKRDSVMFLTSAMLSKVAERHSNVSTQEAMTMWLNRLDLLNPAVFLPRLGQVIDAIVEGQWWYDREVLRSRLPVH
ncbi:MULTISPECIES: hypothetical protein [Thiothrix]|jgi:hypothetical protein|uniref:Uncharacterized protein n=2 Tax=Thiothrix TaxID=1030 RepID=A0A975F942_9GAMM|nr:MULTISPECIES: hypothetical protein [Thiothrix]AMP48662.1 hypothetical protein [uncultured bacterium]OQX06767.1 MAG: hypothetical protein BWK73_30005 [Thiothrix lacustris]AMP48671.1 hypothetical protein [uncultured bacterium]MDX9990110.1 hypothetical protein [Thiothrix unzii]QTR53695.1 hypothetical protein J9260_00975 [Thiothrix unzii]